MVATIAAVVSMVSTVLAAVLMAAVAVAITVRLRTIPALYTAQSAAMGREPEHTENAVVRVVSVSPRSAAVGNFTHFFVSVPPRTA